MTLVLIGALRVNYSNIVLTREYKIKKTNKAVTCDFQQRGILTSVDMSLCSLLLIYEIPNDVRSVA